MYITVKTYASFIFIYIFDTLRLECTFHNIAITCMYVRIIPRVTATFSEKTAQNIMSPKYDLYSICDDIKGKHEIEMMHFNNISRGPLFLRLIAKN